MQYTIHDVGFDPPTVVLPDVTIAAAEAAMIANDDSQVFIVDGQAKVLGIVPDSEFLKHRLMGDELDLPITTLQTKMTIWADSSAPLVSIAFLMRESCHQRLPVVDEGRIHGILTRTRVLSFLRSVANRQTEAPSPPRPKFLSTSITSMLQ